MSSLRDRRGARSTRLVLALAALAPLATARSPTTTQDSPGFCSDIREFVSDLRASPTVTRFCSSFLQIPTPTSTTVVTHTVTDSTTTCVPTVSWTPPSLRWATRDTYHVRDPAETLDVRVTRSPSRASPTATPSISFTPAAFKSQPAPYISTACSCIGLTTPTPVMSTYTTTVAASTALPPAEKTSNAFQLGYRSHLSSYLEADFAGHDAHDLACNEDNEVPFRYRTFQRSCSSYDDCADICALINSAGTGDGEDGLVSQPQADMYSRSLKPAMACPGFTYGGEEGNERCRIKRRIPAADGSSCEGFQIRPSVTAVVAAI